MGYGECLWLEWSEKKQPVYVVGHEVQYLHKTRAQSAKSAQIPKIHFLNDTSVGVTNWTSFATVSLFANRVVQMRFSG